MEQLQCDAQRRGDLRKNTENTKKICEQTKRLLMVEETSAVPSGTFNCGSFRTNREQSNIVYGLEVYQNTLEA